MMDKDAESLGADFEWWQKLTDDYEAALGDLARGEPGARERVVLLANALRRMAREPVHMGRLG
jgi:hypothetical protein